jgi:hypothetical protein
MKDSFRTGCVDRCWFLVLFVAAVQSLSGAAYADAKEDAETLRSLATRVRENMGKIRTWRGEAVVERTPTRKIPLYPGDANSPVALWRKKIAAKFWFSADLDAVRWSLSWESCHYDDQGSPMTPLRRETVDEMVKDKKFYRFLDCETASEGRSEKVLTIWPPERARRGDVGNSFDPMWFFQRYDPVGALETYAVLISRGEKGITVRREGQLVILQADYDDQSMMKRTFDPSQGGNQVEFHSSYSRPDRAPSQEVWTYEEIDGIWVPKSHRRTHDGRPEQAVTLTTSVVNQPIPASEFTLESLGVRPGTRVSDTLLHTTYRYEPPSGQSTVSSEGREGEQGDRSR